MKDQVYSRILHFLLDLNFLNLYSHVCYGGVFVSHVCPGTDVRTPGKRTSSPVGPDLGVGESTDVSGEREGHLDGSPAVFTDQ